jgi:Acyl-CoA reductase (LuxC)
MALAFWLRRAATTNLAAEFARLGSESSVLAPRGLVFHVPPGNVDTMFVYSLAISVLVGNANVVRLSQRQTAQTTLLLDALGSVFEDPRFTRLAATTWLITYPHDDAISAALSAEADVRVLWGGDATIETLRRAPLKPNATELAFADRFSFAVSDAHAYMDLDDGERNRLAEELYNDSYWFDQLGCASPRLFVWCGDEQQALRASQDLWPRLSGVIREHAYRLEPGAIMSKTSYAFESMIDRPVTDLRGLDGNLIVLKLASVEDFDRTHPGAGLFFETTVPQLHALIPFVSRKDQTMTAFGFDATALAEFARDANGRGIDRIVPFGQALQFHRYWDGYDLLQELTRRVHVMPAGLLAPIQGSPA